MQRVGVLITAHPSSSAPCLSSLAQTGALRRCAPARAATSDLCKDKVNRRREAGDSQASQGSATVTFLGAGGQQISVQCPQDTYILDAGLENGIELPYTCRGGICGACVGKVVSGQVDQSDVEDLSFTLSDDEVAEGMALLCMSRAVSDVQVETQSDWGYSLGVGEWKGPSGQISGKTVDPLTPWERQKAEA